MQRPASCFCSAIFSTSGAIRNTVLGGTLVLTAHVVLVFALVALYAAQAEQSGLLGSLGMVLGVVGTTLVSGVVLVEIAGASGAEVDAVLGARRRGGGEDAGMQGRVPEHVQLPGATALRAVRLRGLRGAAGLPRGPHLLLHEKGPLRGLESADASFEKGSKLGPFLVRFARLVRIEFNRL